MNASSLLAALALTACSTRSPESIEAAASQNDTVNETPTTEPVTMARYQEAVQAVETNKARLRALTILSFGDLIMEHPESSGNCYSLPCAGDPADQAHMRELVDQAHRLDQLVTLAEQLDGEEPQRADQSTEAVQALAALDIVDIRGAMVGHCYGPCPDDPETHGLLVQLAAQTTKL